MTDTPPIFAPYIISSLLIATLFIVNFLIELRFSVESVSRNVWFAGMLIISELFVSAIYLNL